MHRVVARPGHLVVLLGLVRTSLAPNEGRSQAPAGQMTWAVHTTLVRALLDPADNIQQTPSVVRLALHDALVKPLLGTLHKIQQLIYERAMFAPVWDFAFRHGVGPRVEESGLGLLGGYVRTRT